MHERMKWSIRTVVAAGVVALSFYAGMSYQAQAQPAGRLYEWRTYTAEPGRLPDLLARFRNHTTRLFEKHGIRNIGYWVPATEPGRSNTLIYIVSHDSQAAADKSWVAFRADPEWVKARTESEKAGKIVTKVESMYLHPTDFSALK